MLAVFADTNIACMLARQKTIESAKFLIIWSSANIYTLEIYTCYIYGKQ